jgi:hypothetical protein
MSATNETSLQRTLTTSHVHQPLEAGEVVGGEQSGGGPCDALGHGGIEDCGVGRMVGEVLEEALPEVIIYNSGRYRMAGRGSLAGLLPYYGDANQIVVDMAAEVLPVVKQTPVLAGVCGTDPFRQMEVFLPQFHALS